MVGVPISLLMPIAVVAAAGYRWWSRMNAEEELDDVAAMWAIGHGFERCDPPPLPQSPTLQQQGGLVHDCWRVQLGDSDAALYRFTWVIDQREGELGETTVVQATLAAGFPHFRVLPRHGRAAPAGGWHESELELESVEFSNQFRVLAGRDADRESLLRLFDPETIVWFIGQGATMATVEYGLGTLVLASRVPCTTDVELDALLAQAQHLAQRILAEGLLHRPDAALPA